ncbi:hypothetical protein MSG28_014855 [Choristoneura fumiferana]|uniref:Uncharacterized protein n=1 Tax=Choristoneura fumiferana TaxID=7141 RepID=A0ACC0JTE3_CHOFU|nr:hypothetical protein MSG28_014855 [Choristoneura fumiferana]
MGGARGRGGARRRPPRHAALRVSAVAFYRPHCAQAVEAGHTAVAAALLAAGADGRAHPVTKYCPLYIACYHGHKELAKLLLPHFPEAVQQETVEKWLPLHAACIGGHAELVTLLLEFEYPADLLSTYTDETGKWEYQAAFDVNAVDARGQSALYVASTLGCLAVCDALLAHAVPCRPAPQAGGTPEAEAVRAPAAVLSPQRGISLGIHAIVSRLTGQAHVRHTHLLLHSTRTGPELKAAFSPEIAREAVEEKRIHPVRWSVGRGADSCVGAAARGGHARCVRRLLAAGAPAGSPAAPPENEGAGTRDSRRRSRSASAASSISPSPSPGRGSSDRKYRSYMTTLHQKRPSSRWTDDVVRAAGNRWMHVASCRSLWRSNGEAFV